MSRPDWPEHLPRRDREEYGQNGQAGMRDGQAHQQLQPAGELGPSSAAGPSSHYLSHPQQGPPHHHQHAEQDIRQSLFTNTLQAGPSAYNQTHGITSLPFTHQYAQSHPHYAPNHPQSRLNDDRGAPRLGLGSLPAPLLREHASSWQPFQGGPAPGQSSATFGTFRPDGGLGGRPLSGLGYDRQAFVPAPSGPDAGFQTSGSGQSSNPSGSIYSQNTPAGYSAFSQHDERHMLPAPSFLHGDPAAYQQPAMSSHPAGFPVAGPSQYGGQYASASDPRSHGQIHGSMQMMPAEGAQLAHPSMDRPAFGPSASRTTTDGMAERGGSERLAIYPTPAPFRLGKSRKVRSMDWLNAKCNSLYTACADLGPQPHPSSLTGTPISQSASTSRESPSPARGGSIKAKGNGRSSRKRDRTLSRSAVADASDPNVRPYGCGVPECKLLWKQLVAPESPETTELANALASIGWQPPAPGMTSDVSMFSSAGELSDHVRNQHPTIWDQHKLQRNEQASKGSSAESSAFTDPILAKLFCCTVPRCGKGWGTINGLQYHVQVSGRGKHGHWRMVTNVADNNQPYPASPSIRRATAAGRSVEPVSSAGESSSGPGLASIQGAVASQRAHVARLEAEQPWLCPLSEEATGLPPPPSTPIATSALLGLPQVSQQQQPFPAGDFKPGPQPGLSQQASGVVGLPLPGLPKLENPAAAIPSQDAIDRQAQADAITAGFPPEELVGVPCRKRFRQRGGLAYHLVHSHTGLAGRAVQYMQTYPNARHSSLRALSNITDLPPPPPQLLSEMVDHMAQDPTLRRRIESELRKLEEKNTAASSTSGTAHDAAGPSNQG